MPLESRTSVDSLTNKIRVAPFTKHGVGEMSVRYSLRLLSGAPQRAGGECNPHYDGACVVLVFRWFTLKHATTRLYGRQVGDSRGPLQHTG